MNIENYDTLIVLTLPLAMLIIMLLWMNEALKCIDKDKHPKVIKIATFIQVAAILMTIFDAYYFVKGFLS